MLEQYFVAAAAATLKLVEIESVQSAPCARSPFGKGVADCLDFVADQAREYGFKVGKGDGYYTWAEIGEGELFGILGHVDTVPIGKGWTKDPKGQILNNVMYGRGVLDDKGPMTLAFFAVCALLGQGKKPKRRIRFIWGGNEESGWKCIDRYLSREEIPAEGVSPDADFPVINCEKGVINLKVTLPKPLGLVEMKGGERPNIVMAKCRAKLQGNIHAEAPFVKRRKSGEFTILTADGVAAHGSTPERGVNALRRMLTCLASTGQQEYRELSKLFGDYNGVGLGIDCKDIKSGKLTCNVGMIDTDDQNLYVTLDIRHPVDIAREEIISTIRKIDQVKDVELLAHHDPLYVSPDDPLVKTLLDAYNDVTGENAAPIAIGGATYARALPKAVAFGPIFPDMNSTIHMPDEGAPLGALRAAYEIYKAAFAKLLFE